MFIAFFKEMKNPEEITKKIGKVLRQYIFQKGYSVASFTKEMKISYSTMKRWMAGEGMTLKDFITVIEMLDLDFEDIANKIDNETRVIVYYTEEQETAFREEPELKDFYDLIWEEGNPYFIGMEKRIHPAVVMRYIFKLEQLKLLVWNSVLDYKLTTRNKPVSKTP